MGLKEELLQGIYAYSKIQAHQQIITIIKKKDAKARTTNRHLLLSEDDYPFTFSD
jgi:hypothetical protein